MSIVPSVSRLSMRDLSLVASVTTKFASGTATSNSGGTYPFTVNDSTTSYFCYVLVTGLTFTPNKIVVIKTTPDSGPTVASLTDYFGSYGTSRIALGNGYTVQLTGNAYIDSTGFKLPVVGSVSESYKWYAYA